MQVRTAPKKKIRMGDTVKVAFGGRKVSAKVVENLGNIGVRGRQLIRISIPVRFSEPVDLALPAEEVELYRPRAK